MNVLVLTKNLDTYNFGDYLRDEGYVPILCPDFDSVLKFESSVEATVLVCDFRLFEGRSRNPYESVSKILDGRKLPFLFYNDPFPDFDRDSLLKHWMGTVSEFCGEISPDLQKFMDSLALAVVSGAVHGGSGFKHVDEIPSDNPFVIRKLEKLKSLFGMPESKNRLLEFLFIRFGTAVDIKDMSQMLWKRFDSHTVDNLYAYISYIRKRLEKYPELEMTIEKIHKGKYVLTANEEALTKL